jgi:hypothetical protein
MSDSSNGLLQELGMGRVYVALCNSSWVQQEGGRNIGNTPAFGLTGSEETKEIFSSSDVGRPLLASGTTKRITGISFEVTDLSRENLAMFQMGTSASAAQGGTGSVTSEAVWATGFIKDRTYELAYRLVKKTPTDIVVSFGGSAGTVTTDYVVDYASGTIYIPTGCTKTGAITATYAYDQTTEVETVSPCLNQIKAYVRFLGMGDVGPLWEGKFWRVVLSPEGSFDGFIGEDFGRMKFTGKLMADLVNHSTCPTGKWWRVS